LPLQAGEVFHVPLLSGPRPMLVREDTKLEEVPWVSKSPCRRSQDTSAARRWALFEF
jgi:hypothetical protein